MSRKNDRKKGFNGNYITNIDQIYRDSMPFYVETIGMQCLKKGHIEKKSKIQSRSITLGWGVRGTGRVNIGGAEAVVEKDSIFLSYPGEESRKEALSEEWEFRWLSLAGPLACAVVMSYGFPRFLSSCRPYPEELFAKLEELCMEKSLFAQRRTGAVVLDILAHADGFSVPFSPYERLVDRAEEYIKQNLGDPGLSVENIAEYFQVSRVTLNKAYREHHFPSPGRRILNQRLNHARELIYGTDLPVSEISRLCGFADPHTFTRFIKRALGMSPLQCRKQKLSEAPSDVSPTGETEED